MVATTGPVGEMADMFTRLSNSGLEPARFTMQTPTLDDVFLKILNHEKEKSHATPE